MSALENQINKYLNHTIIVEGKNDQVSLQTLGFKKVFILHSPNLSINNSIEKILSKIKKSETICILTDSDSKGKQLFSQIKKTLQIHGFKTDSSLRKILAKEGISHIQGLHKFIANNKD